jgi:hypothetical protein
MIFVRELEIWGAPGEELEREESDRLIGQIASELGLPEMALIPYHSIPDKTDVENLSICLLEGELTLEAFTRFCHLRGLNVDLADEEVASKFLIFSFGQKLAWLHLSMEYDNDKQLVSISSRLKRHSLALIDPESLVCLIA